MITTACHWCNALLKFVPGRGWVHPEGGIYVVRCRSCGWKAAPEKTPHRCPQCGDEIYDDHCALPVRLSR